MAILSLDDSACAVDSLRAEILFGRSADNEIATVADYAFPPRTKEHFLRALAFLDLARSELQSADYCRMRNE